jgi:hypothetical protein
MKKAREKIQERKGNRSLALDNFFLPTKRRYRIRFLTSPAEYNSPAQNDQQASPHN